MKARLALSVLAFIISGVSAQAATSVDLQFNGSGNSLAATGFDGVYQEDTSNYNVGGGSLTINIQPGDIFGRYEASSDPDDAKNVFYSNLDAQTSTTVQAKLTANNLNQNFHGGGIWLGTDEDHYIRLGLSHNTFEGGVVVEVLRENEDLWPGEGGPGGDILSARSTPVGSPLSAVTIWLKLVRDGSAAQGYFSTDGLGWTSVGPQFTGIVTGPGQGYNGGPLRMRRMRKRSMSTPRKPTAGMDTSTPTTRAAPGIRLTTAMTVPMAIKGAVSATSPCENWITLSTPNSRLNPIASNA